MTAIFYPDREAVSPSGRFLLEARSPHNGAILHRDGRPASQDDYASRYREHQSEFRYRLLDLSSNRPLGWGLDEAAPAVVWERFQARPENPPHELLVSDDGWAVIRTHGFAPEVIAVGLDGRDDLRVRITGADGDDGDKNSKVSGPTWALAHLVRSTAGAYWSMHSWRGFFRYREATYFAWRASWGQRLVLDLEHATAFTDEQSLPEGSSEAVLAAERAGVRALLESLSRQMDEVRIALACRYQADDDCQGMRDRMWLAVAALHLVGVHRLEDCIPFLREWEGLDLPAWSRGSTAMRDPWRLQTQRFRPVVHNALKLLGEQTRGFPTYGFIAGQRPDLERFPLPTHLPDRRARTASLTREMAAADVLRLVGSPDFIRRKSRQEGRGYRWSEDWEYDFRDPAGWTTFRLTWEEERRQSRLTTIVEIAPYWLDSDEREAGYLRL